MALARQNRWTIALGLVLLAGTLRFHKLGDWPFAGDELATLEEEEAFYGNKPVSPESQIYRLPHIIPLSHFFHHVGQTLFGRDEFGSRVLLAVFGTLGVGAAFLLLDSLQGRPSAVATALLMAVCPEQIFQSQQTRYYIIVAFFAGLAMLLGGFVARRRSTPSAIVVCLVICAAILCHTLMAILLPIIWIGIVAGSKADRQPFPKNVAGVFLVTSILVAVFALLYVKPYMSGWNSGATWGYGVVHSLLAAINGIGWPIALLAMLGGLMMLRERNPQNWYWLACAAGWGSACVLFPRIVAYHPSYVFPLAIGMFVPAGFAVGTVYECLRTKGAFLGAAWMGLACLLTLPNLASHYVDGSREDIRTAAQYVKCNWRPGDRVTGFTMGGFAHYAPGCEPAIPLSSDAVRSVQELVRNKKRLWVVVQSFRGGLAWDLEHYLGTHFSHELKVRRTRFDYAEYCVDVFLYSPQPEKGSGSDSGEMSHSD
jgi:hypothetical protein